MVSLYDLSVPVYVRALENLLNVLKAGEKWADENNIEHSKLIEARLAPDMHPLPFHVQTASNTSKAVLPRIAGYEAPKMEDNEKSFAEFYSRLERTIDALKAAKQEDFEGKEDLEVQLFDGKIRFTALVYLTDFGMPNFWFHVVTAYDVLRAQGVPLGKELFIGGERPKHGTP